MSKNFQSHDLSDYKKTRGGEAKSPFRTDEVAKENILILISEIRSRLQKWKKG